jgi:hypothetical protein
MKARKRVGGKMALEEIKTPAEKEVAGKKKVAPAMEDFLRIFYYVGILAVGTVLLCLILKKESIGDIGQLIFSWRYGMAACAALLFGIYGFLKKNDPLALANKALTAITVIMAIYLLVPWGWEKTKEKREEIALFFKNPVATATYVPPLGFVPGESSFSLNPGERKMIRFRPGIKTSWAINTERSRCENDSLLIIGDGRDTLRSWLPDQHWNGKHDQITLVALAPMRDIKLTIW